MRAQRFGLSFRFADNHRRSSLLARWLRFPFNFKFPRVRGSRFSNGNGHARLERDRLTWATLAGICY